MNCNTSATEKAGAVQPGEELAQGDLINVYKYSNLCAERMEAGSSTSAQ